MSLEKVSGKEAVLHRNVEITTEAEAVVRFREVAKYLEFYRPHEINLPKRRFPLSRETVFWGDTNVNITASAGFPFIGLAIGSLFTTWCIFGLSALTLSLVTFLSIRSNNGRHKNKIRNFLCNVFLTKNAKATVKENGLLLDEYENSLSMYKLLVEKARIKLESEGVFQLVNHKEQTKFIYLDPTGKPHYLSLAEWRQKSNEVDSLRNLQQEISKEIMIAT